MYIWAFVGLIHLPDCRRIPRNRTEGGGGLDGRAGRSATLFLSRVNMEEHLLRGPRDVGETEIPMKRKSGKSVVDLGKEPAVVHFNVGSGYVSYLESDTAGQTPRAKSVVI